MKLFAVVSVGLSLLSIINAAPINLTKRRFGQEHTPEADATYQAMKDLVQGTTFEEVMGNLSGEAVRALLARAPKCEQQDVADKCIDQAHKIGDEVSREIEENLIDVCKTYRTLERNTPNVGQPSELCDRPPRNPELDGLTQRQDPTTPENPSTPPENPSTPPDNPSTPPENPSTPPDNPSTPPENPSTPPDNPSTPPENPSTPPDNPSTPPENPSTPPENPSTPPENPVNAVPNSNEAFNNPVGGAQMPLITRLNPGGPEGNFQVKDSKFQQVGAAHNRQCDVQHNACFDKFNSGDRSFQGSDCDEQNNVCKAGEPVFAA